MRGKMVDVSMLLGFSQMSLEAGEAVKIESLARKTFNRKE